jgi:hypothetical protein
MLTAVNNATVNMATKGTLIAGIMYEIKYAKPTAEKAA